MSTSALVWAASSRMRPRETHQRRAHGLAHAQAAGQAGNRSPARARSMTPNSRAPTLMALSGQMAMHPPQPWHISGKVMIIRPMTEIALNWHSSAHLRQ